MVFILPDVCGPTVVAVSTSAARISAASGLVFILSGSSCWCTCRGVLLPSLGIRAAHRALMQMKPCGTSQDATVHLHAVISARPPASVKRVIAARLVRPAVSGIFMIRHCSVSGTASTVIDNNTFMGTIYDPDTMVL